MKNYQNPNRREVIIGGGTSMVAVSLSGVLTGTSTLAATPKKGGKLIYVAIPNSKHKTLKKAKHPYYGLEIRTTITEDMAEPTMACPTTTAGRIS